MTTFEEYAQANLAGLLRLAGVLSRDPHIAEDVVQEVLFRASQRWDQVSASAAPGAYVRRMVVNEYLSWRRKWARITPRSEIDADHVAPDHAEALVERDAMEIRLKTLPARQRVVLVLRYYEGMSDQQIAETLNCSSGAVRTAASRALASLRIDSNDVLMLNRKAH